jgi:Peptidase family S41
MPRAAAVSDSIIEGSRISHQFSNRNTADFEGPKATPFPGLFPNFDPPSSFKLRLGNSLADIFVSGTFKSDTLTLGYLRIHNFANTAAALRQIQTETTYFQQNTDGLVIDLTGTDSVSFCGEEAYLSYFIPHTFQGLGWEYRGTEFWLNFYATQLQAAKSANQSQWIVDLWAAYLQEMQQAHSEPGGKTGPLARCRPTISAEPARDSAGNIIAYTKPIVLLTDEMSYADVFAAIFQDEQRGLIVGQRTSGLGGGAIQYFGGNYSEGFVFVNANQLTRSKLVSTPDYPGTSFIENVGVRPDIVVEYQTKDNLLNGGSAYVGTVVAAAADWIKKNR